ncbi:ABC transporter substrate-binding protein [Streptomyces sp. NBC_00963]|uniref:ABC transporter substrate-binding protein n=1 Tax=unclassified Streptomyces TaxID=2593676 RepID=UPI00224DD27A|nr:ABC transporter substrate-binding protein [Streptomyces sp. NBC_01306]MCX4727869.1 ABC transporter substrate-binding protein [Streptomyces sp. NBC_01306]WSX40963.1 ABC transporter substrate-binding protein [Streptomyces sp. NBC_00963]
MKRRCLGALLIPFALLTTACGGKSADTHTRTTLNVGDQTGGDRAMLEASGELDNMPYKINWSNFASGPLLLEAVNAKAVDLGWTGNTPPVFAAASKSKITVVGAMHSSVAGTAILVPKNSPLKSVHDLKGKKIAVMQGTTGHDLLLGVLRKAGMSIKDVKVDYLQSAEAKTAFKRGDVDAWAAADPTTTQALDGGNARVLVSGQGLVNGLTFDIASPSALADKGKSAAMKDYMQRLQRARKWVYQHPQQWAKVWAKDTGVPYKVALDAVRRTSGTTVRVAVDRAAVASEQQIADEFAGLKLIPERFTFSDFVDTRFNAGVPPSTTPPHAF